MTRITEMSELQVDLDPEKVFDLKRDLYVSRNLEETMDINGVKQFLAKHGISENLISVQPVIDSFTKEELQDIREFRQIVTEAAKSNKAIDPLKITDVSVSDYLALGLVVAVVLVTILAVLVAGPEEAVSENTINDLLIIGQSS